MIVATVVSTVNELKPVGIPVTIKSKRPAGILTDHEDHDNVKG